MKFLHLADLHIGKTVNGFSMIGEQGHAIDQILGFIDAEQPQAVVIAGDVYDRPVPNIEAVRLFDDFLTRLAERDLVVLLISGNHDSPERLDFSSRLLAEQQLHLRGVFNGRLEPVILEDEHGEVFFWLIPFIKPSMLRGLLDTDTGGGGASAGADTSHSGAGVETYSDALRLVLESADINYNTRNIVITHQFYRGMGADPLRSESEFDPVGGLDAIDVTLLKRFDYAALGHLHREQRIGADSIRYAGSPIKYSFSEAATNKSVTLVELGKKGEVSLTRLPLTPLHDLREIKGPLATLLSPDYEHRDDPDDYLHVTLTDEDEIIDPIGKVRAVYPNVMALDFDNSRVHIDLDEIKADLDKVEQFSTFDLFSDFFLNITGSQINENQRKIISELLQESVEEQQQ